MIAPKTSARGPFLPRWRALTAVERTPGADLGLVLLMAGIAGAANAGGFFAVGQFTSHMSGYVSQFANGMVLGQIAIAANCAFAIAAFTCGAGFGGVLVSLTRQHARARANALPFAVQSGLMACFAAGDWIGGDFEQIFALWCLCFIMGQQNATVALITGGYRTTHITATVTDIGVDLGRLALELLCRIIGWQPPSPGPDLARLGRLSRLAGSFLGGGIIGAIGYGHGGFAFSLVPAALLLALAWPGLHRPG